MRLKKFNGWYGLGLLLLLVACNVERQPSAFSLPATLTPSPSPPSPSATFPPALSSPTPTLLPTEAPAPWQHFPSYNDVQALAFAPDGALWAAIIGGVVRWDLTTDSPTFYAIEGAPYTDVVHDIAVAFNGEIWAATSGGVARFDGVAWTLYTRADGLPFDMATSLAFSPDGVVWASGDGGLAHFDGTFWRAVALPFKFSDVFTWAVGAAPDGSIWASTHNRGILHYDPRTRVWTPRANFSSLNTRVLTVGPDGAPWVHNGYDNVYRFNGETWEMAYESTGGRWVCDMAFPAGSTTPYIATCEGFHTYGTGLAYFNGTTWDYITVDDGLLRNIISAVAVAPDGTLAVGTDRGISLGRGQSWRALRYGPALREVTAVAVTGDGVAWFGFGTGASRPPGGGITRFDGQTWQYFDAPSAAANANVLMMTVSPSGDLWAANGCGVLRFTGGAWQTFVPCDGSLIGNVRSIAFASNDDVWIASDFNVGHYVGDAQTIYSGQLPTALAITTAGEVWLAHSTLAGGGLSTFDGTAWITQTTTPLTMVHHLLVTPDGALWAAGINGVFRFDGAQWASYEGLPEGEGVAALVAAPDGALWAATSSSLFFLNGARWQEISLPFEVTVYSLFCAPDGTLWLGTSKGALHYHP